MTGLQYHFRNFRLDPAARELWQDHLSVTLPASAFDGLLYLIEHRDRAVGRDELIAAIWGRADVADTLLAQTVLRIRRELGDAGAEQSAIRTVPRFGYRWIEETRAEAGAAVPEPSAVPAPDQWRSVTPPRQGTYAPPEPATKRVIAGGRRAMFVGIVAAALLALASLHYWRSSRSGAAEQGEWTANVAAVVLPAATPEQAEWGWLRLGLMDLVAGRLRQAGMATAPSESVLVLLRQSADLKRALPHALAVQPMAQFHDSQWTVSLSATQSGTTFTAQGSSADVLAAARFAVDALLIRLGRAPPPAVASAGPALQELLQRTRAAILADQFDLAQNLVAHAAPELQRNPEVALRRIQIELGQGDYATARRELTLLLDEVPKDLAPALRGKMLNTLGGIDVLRGDLASADAAYAEALAVLQPVDDAIGLGQAYAGRGAIAARRGDTATAATELGRARVAFEAGGDVLGVAQIDTNLGVLAGQRYRPAEALPVLRDAVARLASIGAREELAHARFALIGVQLQLLDIDGARATSDATWPADAHTGHQRLRWQLTLARAGILIEQGSLDAAQALLAKIDSDAAPDLDAGTRAGSRALAARIAAMRGNDAQTAALASAALTPELEREDGDVYLATWFLRTRALRRDGQIHAAAEATVGLRAWVDAHANEWRQIYAALAEAEQAHVERGDAAALAGFADAVARADRVGIPEDRVETGAAYLQALLAAGQTDRASAVAGAVAPWAATDLRAAGAEAELFRALDRQDAWRRAVERATALAGERVVPSLMADSSIARH